MSEADVEDVVRNIVERAKAGDKAAIGQLFDHVLGCNARPTRVVNNLVVEDVETAARAAAACKSNGTRLTERVG